MVVAARAGMGEAEDREVRAPKVFDSAVSPELFAYAVAFGFVALVIEIHGHAIGDAMILRPDPDPHGEYVVGEIARVTKVHHGLRESWSLVEVVMLRRING